VHVCSGWTCVSLLVVASMYDYVRLEVYTTCEYAALTSIYYISISDIYYYYKKL
jgi:hypothetical protein